MINFKGFFILLFFIPMWVFSLPANVIDDDVYDNTIHDEYAQNWELMADLNVGGSLPLVKYRSKRTGLTVTLDKVESPLVTGHFCLLTESKTDDGLPHTLEHLIFRGRYGIQTSH